MKIDDFKKAHTLQIEILAYKKLAEMLGNGHVVLTAAKEGPSDDMSNVFAHIFGEGERRVLNESVKNSMIDMVNDKLSELKTQFEQIGT